MNPYIIPGLKIVPIQSANLKVDFIITAVCNTTGLQKEKLFLKNRQQQIVESRQLCMYFLRKYTRLTLKQIGAYFLNQDHTTVLHSINTVKNISSVDVRYRHMLQRIDEYIESSKYELVYLPENV